MVKRYIEDIQTLEWIWYLFTEWSEKCILLESRSHKWNILFLASRDEINIIFMTIFCIFFLLYLVYNYASFSQFFALNGVIHDHALLHINDDIAECVCQNWNHRSRESEKFSKSQQFYYQNFPCNQTMKMNTHTSEVCSRKSTDKAISSNFTHEIQTYIFTCEIQLLYFHMWNITFPNIHYT